MIALLIRRRILLGLAAAGVTFFLGSEIPDTQVAALALLLLTPAVVVVSRVARRNDVWAYADAYLDHLWDVVDATPGAEAWMVEQAISASPVTRVLLSSVNGDDRQTRELWGAIYQGDCLVLVDGIQEPLVRVPNSVMNAAVQAQSRRS